MGGYKPTRFIHEDQGFIILFIVRSRPIINYFVGFEDAATVWVPCFEDSHSELGGMLDLVSDLESRHGAIGSPKP